MVFERIMVPLDGSTLAESVLVYAGALASRFDAEITVFRAVKPRTLVASEIAPPAPIPPATVQLGAEAVQDVFEAEMKEAREYVDRVAQRLAGLRVRLTTGVLEGDASTSIIDFARLTASDLICMSTHGRSGVERAIIGSVTDSVIRNSHLPVLTIRPANA